MSNIGFSTLSVIPSMKGFGAKVAAESDPALAAAGKSGGAKFGTFFKIGALAVVAGVAGILKTGIGEALDASAGTAQLAAGIKSTGNAANVSVKSLNALASSIQGYSGQTDDSIVKSEQLLLTFTNIKNAGPDKIFDLATKATADMAAKMGGDASGSAILLGKALNDPVKGITALTRVGVSFTQAQKDQIAAMVKSGDTIGAQKIILGELNKEFGGAAKAAGQSLPGQLARARRAFEDVSQAIAEKLLPIAIPAFIGLAAILTNNLIPAIVAVAHAISVLVGFIKSNETTFKVIGTIIAVTLIPAFVAWGVQATIAATKNVAAWLSAKIGAAESAALQVASLTLLAAGWVRSGVAAIAGAARQAAAWVLSKAGALGTVALYGVAFGFIAAGWLSSAAAATAGALGQAAAWIASKVEAAASLALQIPAFIAIAAGWVASAAASTAGAIAMAAAWLIAIGPIALAIAAIVGVVVLVVQNWDTIKAATIAVWDAVSSAVSTAVSFVLDFIKAHWPLILAIITGPIGLAVLFIVKNWDTIKTATADAWNAVKSAVSGAIGAVKSTITTGFNDVVGFVKGLPGRITAIAGDFLSAGKKLGSKVIEGIGSGLKSAGGFVSDLAGSIKHAINSALHLPFTIHGPGPLPDFTIPAFARGTNFAPGGMSLVGERGPELVNLPRGSQVATAAETRGLLGGLSVDDMAAALATALSGLDVTITDNGVIANQSAGHIVTRNNRMVPRA